MYRRVIPRDLFNESKLLKCLGQLAMAVHDGHDFHGWPCHMWLTMRQRGNAFTICQRDSDGGLVCDNVVFMKNKVPLVIYSAYNDKEPYPLYCETSGDDIEVLNNDGSLSDEFLAFLKS
jgi:hypothetical protein